MRSKWRKGLRAPVLMLLGFCLVLMGMNTQATEATALALQAVKYVPLPDNKLQIQFSFSQPVKEPPVGFVLRNPDRIVLDFKGATNRLPQAKPASTGVVREVTAVEANGRTRLIIDLTQPVGYQTQMQGSQIWVTLDAPPPAPIQAALPATRAVSTSNGQVVNKTTTAAHQINKIVFRPGKNGSGEVVVELSDSNVVVNLREAVNRLTAQFFSTSVPAQLQQHVDVRQMDTPVQTIDTTIQGSDVFVQVNTSGSFKHLSYQVNKQFIIEIQPVTSGTKAAQPPGTLYGGERLSLDFQDIKTRAVLQILAEFTGLNIVTSDSVTGSVTLRLHNVPWDQALEIIMKTQGLDKRQMGNVLLIAPTEELAAREKQELMAKQQVTSLEPLRSDLIQINYGKATDIATLLKDKSNTLLSERGTVSVDVRTNTIWVQDTATKLQEVRKLIKRLDMPVRQVLIEARIVNVNSDFERDLGVKFGITRPDHVTGTLEGANSLLSGTVITDIDPTQRLNLNLPATPATGNAATLGIALARLGNNLLLDLELSALESEGKGELISTPRLITANSQAAFIESGEEIPFQEATSSGATSTSFKKAVLSLKVTPQITPDGKVILDLEVSQDTRGRESSTGVPAINTKEIKTQVLVDNGETIVLGGIYEQTKKHDIQRIPFLGKLPVVGNLFKHDRNINNHQELLIFVTPRIVQQVPFTRE